jgi:hypothetical protein
VTEWTFWAKTQDTRTVADGGLDDTQVREAINGGAVPQQLRISRRRFHRYDLAALGGGQESYCANMSTKIQDPGPKFKQLRH